MCLVQRHNTDSNLQPLNLELSTLPMSHCVLYFMFVAPEVDVDIQGGKAEDINLHQGPKQK